MAENNRDESTQCSETKHGTSSTSSENQQAVLRVQPSEKTEEPPPEEEGIEQPFIPPESAFSRPPDIIKEEAATLVAKYIVQVFKYAVLAGLGGIFAVVLVCFFWQNSSAAAPLLKDAVVPSLERLGTFATTVFGPLLAFILGYYFGGSSKGSKPTG